MTARLHGSIPIAQRGVLVGALSAAGGAVQATAAAPDEAVWFGRDWAVKWRDGEKIWLALYRKRLGAPHPGEPPRPVLFLVHGSSAVFSGNSARLYAVKPEQHAALGAGRFAALKATYEQAGPAPSNLRYGYVQRAA